MKRMVACLCFAACLCAQDTGTQQNWPHYGGGLNAWRHSALSQINQSNVKKLAPAWVFQTGMPDGGLQSTPIVVDGVMYLSTSWNRVFAIDAESATLVGLGQTNVLILDQ